MTTDKSNPEPAQPPRRKWKQAEALEAIEILKATDPVKWAEYVSQELGEAQIEANTSIWIQNILMPKFKTDQLNVLWLYSKVRANINPKWENDRKDDQ
jgi:hypothetical protein